MRILYPALCLGLSLVGPAHADETNWEEAMAEATWDWHPGDLIFRNGVNEIDELIRDSEGGKWASVGILRASSGGPRVVYADQKSGVTEVMLYEFVDGLEDDEYSVYRITSLDPNKPGEQMIMGPVASYSLFVAYGRKFDNLMMFGNGSYYNAELPYLAAQSSGVILSKMTSLDNLADKNAELRSALLTNWEDHPYCEVQASPDDCWNEIKEISVTTPASIIASDAVTRVFPE